MASLLSCITTAITIANVVALAMLICGGFYTRVLPIWMRWSGNISSLRFAYRSMIQIVYGSSQSVHCIAGYKAIIACHNSTSVPGEQVVHYSLGTDNVPSLLTNVVVLLMYLFLFRQLSYLVLITTDFKLFQRFLNIGSSI